MNEYTNTIPARTLNIEENNGVVSSLYSLMEAINHETKPGEEHIVPTIVNHMLKSGKVKLLCSKPECANFVN